MFEADIHYRVEDRGHKTPCWIWRQVPTNTGYGLVSTPKGRRLVHRVSYEFRYGTIEDGLTIDHLCRNRLCMNPEHLEAVSMAVNTQRGKVAKFSPEVINAVLAAEGLQREIAQRFGVSRSHVANLRRGQMWTNIREGE